MTNFKSKPLQDLLFSHTRLNNYIKISVVAVDHLYKSTTNINECSELINKLILDSDQRWTPRIMKNDESKLVKNDLSKSGIIWVYSSFDVFFKQVEGQLSPFFPEDESENIDESSTKLIRFYNKLNWPLTNIYSLLPILKFYETIRHCIAHNRGNPTTKLLELSNNDDFLKSIENWETKYVKKSISAAPVVTESAIELSAHHPIMYSETCLRIATDINDKLYLKFGINHFIDLTIKNHLLTSQLTSPYCTNLSRYLVYHLKQDYNISISPYDKVYEFYTNEELLKTHKKRYLTLKGKT